MSRYVRQSLLLVLGILGLARHAVGQTPVVVRGVGSSLGGGYPVITTGVAGLAVGVQVSERVELFGEFAFANGIAYPPPDPLFFNQAGGSGSPSVGPPVAIVIYVLEWARHDRLLVGGGRLTTSRRVPLWFFAEGGGGTIRRVHVLNGPRGLVSRASYRPVGVVGGGVAGRLGRFEAEAGYRIGLFTSDDDFERLNQVRAAIGVRF